MRKKLRKAARIIIGPQTVVIATVLTLLVLGFQAPRPGQAAVIQRNAEQPGPGSVNIVPSPQTPSTSQLPASSAPKPTAVQPPKPDCGVQQCLALTFDDGPSPSVTPRVLDILEKHGVHATFFLVGSRVPGNHELLQRMYKDGNEIGSHSWSHADLTKLPPQQVKDQVALAQAAITDSGVPAPTIFRPPYGAINQNVEADIPMSIAMWNVDPQDWKAKTQQEIIDKVKSGSAPGRVILLHDRNQMTADALDQLIAELKGQYQLVTFSELFGLTPGQRGYFYGR